MHPVFISYSSPDRYYAEQLQTALSCAGIDAWFAPKDIGSGDDFTEEIAAAIHGCTAMIVLLSEHYMASKWCPKELKMAINEGKKIHSLRIDHAPDTAAFSLMLVDIQTDNAYHLNGDALEKLRNELTKELRLCGAVQRAVPIQKISCGDIGMLRITGGDPYYEEGRTLRTRLTGLEFYLAPPRVGLTEEQAAFLDAHHFAKADRILDTSLEAVAAQAEAHGVFGLIDCIAASREQVLQDFLHGRNGCYFNNKKYGVNRIRPYGRTEDLGEQPDLEIDFYTTDYYTHRVMKDVCKRYAREDPDFWRRHIEDFVHLDPWRILFTSFGINLLLLDTDENTLLTCRSANCTETDGKFQYSMSVIEGVSLSDYDAYERNVRLSTAAERGLLEELGVGAELLQRDSIRYYDLFVNLRNLEIGISCAVMLKQEYSIADSVLCLHGKDEELEVAEKRICPIPQLHAFLYEHREEFLTQAVYAIGTYLESLGTPVLEYTQRVVLLEEVFLHGKRRDSTLCGDAIYEGAHYIAIIDGNTPKGTRMWDGLPSDVFVAGYLREQMDQLPEGLTAEEAICRLNDSLRACYRENEFETIAPEERLSASILIYSRDKRELWSFGDCQYRINGVLYNHQKRVDILLAEVRSFFLETELQSGKTVEELQRDDTGRESILPFLRRQQLLANRDCPFGYDVLDGGSIQQTHIGRHAVKTGDHVVMASDGYPQLCETLRESEEKLAQALRNDPLCMYENRGTKALHADNISYDDRAFFSFVVR